MADTDHSAQPGNGDLPRLSEEAQFAIDSLAMARAGACISRLRLAAMLDRAIKWVDRARGDGTIPEPDGPKLKGASKTDRRAVSWRGATALRIVEGDAPNRRRGGNAA